MQAACLSGLWAACTASISPRSAAIANLLLLTIASGTAWIYVALVTPRGVFGCQGIVAGVLALSLLGLGGHLLSAIYLAPALAANTWPWNVVEEESPYSRTRDAPGTSAAHAPNATPGERAASNVGRARRTSRQPSRLTEMTPLIPAAAGAGATPAAVSSEAGALGDDAAAEDDSEATVVAPTPTEAASRPTCIQQTWCWRHGKGVRGACFLSTCTLAVMLVYAFAIIAVWLRNTTVANLTDVNILVQGITQHASLYHDQYGVIHIAANNDNDGFVAQGFAHAQYRMWQMEFQRRVGAGRLAEVAGSAALPIDKVMRTLGVYAAANATYAVLSPSSQAALIAYTAGVNAYITGMNGDSFPRPLEFALLGGYKAEPWTPTDSLVW